MEKLLTRAEFADHEGLVNHSYNEYLANLYDVYFADKLADNVHKDTTTAEEKIRTGIKYAKQCRDELIKILNEESA